MASHTKPHGDFEFRGDTESAESALPSDPLQRLEAELGEAAGGQSDDERLYEEAQGLVEEAWSILTECLSIRDGLLEACAEIERAMGSMQRQIGALPIAIEPDGPRLPANGRKAVASGANGAVAR